MEKNEWMDGWRMAFGIGTRRKRRRKRRRRKEEEGEWRRRPWGHKSANVEGEGRKGSGSNKEH
jgi:hypothetical protein